MSDVEIRLCKTWEECLACEELQHAIWDMPDYRDVVPANLLITALKNGGLLIGAFRDDRMIGFAFGFLGGEFSESGAAPKPARLKHTSHMLGVLPGARAQGVGAQLKWFQRAQAMKQGLDLMTWTYDPLQAVNANLNLTHLGAIARHYIENAYGEMTDALNAGIPSDRFQVEWELSSERVREREFAFTKGAEAPELPWVFQVEWNKVDLPVIVGEKEVDGEGFLVEIPASVHQVKQAGGELALEWRMRTRSVFKRAFAAGYAATEFLRLTDAQGHPRVFYLVRRFGA